MPGATMTVQSVGTGVERDGTTSNSGSYASPNFRSEYKVQRLPKGSRQWCGQRKLRPARVTHADFALQVGQRTETVEVEGTAPLVDLSPNNNNYVDSQKIENVPLNGRDFNSLLAITPGVQRIRAVDSLLSASTVRGQRQIIISSMGSTTTIATMVTQRSIRQVFSEFPR